jgi:hypothetical protein
MRYQIVLVAGGAALSLLCCVGDAPDVAQQPSADAATIPDGGTADASLDDAAKPLDAAPDAGSGYCATHGGLACLDFDDGTLVPKGWTQATSPGAGSGTVELVPTGISTPNAAAAKIASSAASVVRSAQLLLTDVSVPAGASSFRVEVDLRIDVREDPTTAAQLLVFRVGSDKIVFAGVGQKAFCQRDNTVTLIANPSAPPGDEHLFQLSSGTWHRVGILIARGDGGTVTSSCLVDNKVVASGPDDDALGGTVTATLGLLSSVASGRIEARYDNALLTADP